MSAAELPTAWTTMRLLDVHDSIVARVVAHFPRALRSTSTLEAAFAFPGVPPPPSYAKTAGVGGFLSLRQLFRLACPVVAPPPATVTTAATNQTLRELVLRGAEWIATFGDHVNVYDALAARFPRLTRLALIEEPLPIGTSATTHGALMRLDELRVFETRVLCAPYPARSSPPPRPLASDVELVLPASMREYTVADDESRAQDKHPGYVPAYTAGSVGWDDGGRGGGGGGGDIAVATQVGTRLRLATHSQPRVLRLLVPRHTALAASFPWSAVASLHTLALARRTLEDARQLGPLMLIPSLRSLHLEGLDLGAGGGWLAETLSVAVTIASESVTASNRGGDLELDVVSAEFTIAPSSSSASPSLSLDVLRLIDCQFNGEIVTLLLRLYPRLGEFVVAHRCNTPPMSSDELIAALARSPASRSRHLRYARLPSFGSALFGSVPPVAPSSECKTDCKTKIVSPESEAATATTTPIGTRHHRLWLLSSEPWDVPMRGWFAASPFKIESAVLAPAALIERLSHMWLDAPASARLDLVTARLEVRLASPDCARLCAADDNGQGGCVLAFARGTVRLRSPPPMAPPGGCPAPASAGFECMPPRVTAMRQRASCMCASHTRVWTDVAATTTVATPVPVAKLTTHTEFCDAALRRYH